MMKVKIFILLLIITGIILSCEKDITVDLPKAQAKIVIEGAIEQGQLPWIVITRNTPYFEPFNFNIDSASIANFFTDSTSVLRKLVILDAVVTVTDFITTDTLRLTIDPYQLPYVKYKGSSIIGQAGKTYLLKVVAEGKTYTSITSIPNPVPIDSIKFLPEEGYDSLGTLLFYFKDPDTLGNSYRYFTKTIGKDSIFVHPFSSVTSDKKYNGKEVTFGAFRGINPIINNEEKDPTWAFRIGETVMFKFCSLDFKYYQFLVSAERQMRSDGNPFTSPTTVITNISGNALGVWGGYGVSKYILKIKNDSLLQ